MNNQYYFRCLWHPTMVEGMGDPFEHVPQSEDNFSHFLGLEFHAE